MNARPERADEAYGRVLGEYLAGGGEKSLMEAYELGRRAVITGTGLLELVADHHRLLQDALARLPPERREAALRDGGTFLGESLSPFEMGQKAVAEANTILRRLNQLLEDEARRIAHAIHDEAGGILASARVALDLSVRDQPPEVAGRLADVRRLLDDTGERLRHLSHELRPTILDDLGLRAALVFLAQGITQRSGVQVGVAGELRGRPPPAVELAVYRVAQEALNNAIRHARGLRTIGIELSRRRGELNCTIRDDGAGFDVAAVLADRQRTGLGLPGMRERIQSAGGTLRIRSAPGEGTAVEIRIPW